MIKFTQLTDKLNYPPKIKARLSTLHAEIITYVINNFRNTNQYKSNIISLMNTVSYYLICGDSLPANWSPNNPFENIEIIDSSEYEDKLGGNLFLELRDISWDIEESEHSTDIKKSDMKQSVTKSNCRRSEPTPKENLYIKPPTFPQFDITKPWLNMQKDGTAYTIYKTLPIIPENQSQISVTTDVSIMTKSDLMNLYPNCFIRTRAATMYEKHDGLDFDNDIGTIIPISGFTVEQVRENIIKYPHFYKLQRLVDGKCVSFYSNIEIDGILYDTLEVWDSIPDSKSMPKNSDFIKEYVVRRYLLERDILGIQHKYPLFGSLDPFLTLFTTPSDYIKFGFEDVEDVARQCVISRVQYKQSRNPILRKVCSTQ